jgi:hypothetical protein
VRRVLVTGLTTEPEVERDGDALILRAAGLTARFEHASVSRGERALRITRAAR